MTSKDLARKTVDELLSLFVDCVAYNSWHYETKATEEIDKSAAGPTVR
ncbi:MAG: hypothetical protein K8H87_07235 [Pseudorhodoplanes sp.]|nr:hypothetical protein [Pseudorhodoplanes sp.]